MVPQFYLFFATAAIFLTLLVRGVRCRNERKVQYFAFVMVWAVINLLGYVIPSWNLALSLLGLAAMLACAFCFLRDVRLFHFGTK